MENIDNDLLAIETCPDQLSLMDKALISIGVAAAVILVIYFGATAGWSEVWEYAFGHSGRHSSFFGFIMCPLTDVCGPLAR